MGPEGLQRPYHLAFDVLEKLPDFESGVLSLLPLDTGQGCLGFLVREIDLDKTAGQQHSADQSDEDHHVLIEEMPPIRPQEGHGALWRSGRSLTGSPRLPARAQSVVTTTPGPARSAG